MEIINVLENDAFSIASMTAGIQTAPTQPRELKNEGIFAQESIRSEIIAIEYSAGQFQIAPLDERGGVITSAERETRVIRHFTTKRVAKHDRIKASELGFIRQFGSDEKRIIEELQKEIAKRQTGPTGLMATCENRLELMRLGALNGLLLDHNGSVVYDFFAEFGLAAPPTVFLDIANKSEGDLRAAIESQITRPMRRKAKGRMFSHVAARCGESAWDALMKNKEFRERFHAAADAKMAAELHKGTLGTEVLFAGVTWREYFGADDGASVNLGVNDIRFYPGGNSGIFKHILSPGDGFSSLGEQGKEWYTYLVNDVERPQDPRWIDLYVEQYPMIVNSAPDLTFKASALAS
jgi:hypothetical protein